mmetsp:Transcript_103/g.154  ORF Transcript_103/g.154 Transcript_103/m.154 type:complete len:263 (-) Transcript_103:1352-2140(-)|eukprot:CAMPEP_0203760098 /NCGR_PEP_ID=MMETSP0098-20131031/13473_1 /ASSEMBLY_ACC=CAM_ASM_000208 /TAXON_ID=96639 /ORGANISM=" , Strain NY0313808BC1" /LENGTH=262 /DNA_ID=CAMNT_0050653549 /DNA_START=94 /DNA_END=882 /DNA_ORIENTATION=+
MQYWPVVVVLIGIVAYDFVSVNNVDVMFRPRVQVGGRSALVIGGTGATGSKVVDELLSRKEWTKVVVIGRRQVEQKDDKLECIVVDINDDKAVIDEEKLKDIDHFFDCIGTTRSSAGSAEAFHSIEVGITERVAKAAKNAGVKYASVISAKGANKNIGIAPTWFHPLYYVRVMGMKEEAVIDKAFFRTSIFRPGMLARGSDERPIERWFGSIMSSLDVGLLAKAMVNDAEAANVEEGAEPEKPMYFVGNSLITKLSEQEVEK